MLPPARVRVDHHFGQALHIFRCNQAKFILVKDVIEVNDMSLIYLSPPKLIFRDSELLCH